MTAIRWDAQASAKRDPSRMHAPSRWLWLAEGRALYEFGFSLWVWPLLLQAPRGDGHGVLVLPGFLATDASTRPLRDYLRRLGYDARAWELGRNVGGFALRAALLERLDQMVAETGRPVSLIGWSLGGVFARDLAAERPNQVRSVITLGSPFSRDPDSSNVSEIYQRVTREGTPVDTLLDQMSRREIFDRLSGPLVMPATSIYTKSDGIVDWRSCLIGENSRSENIEVIGASHVGLGVHAAVLWALADRLAQPEGLFTAFDGGGPFGCAYAFKRERKAVAARPGRRA